MFIPFLIRHLRLCVLFVFILLSEPLSGQPVTRRLSTWLSYDYAGLADSLRFFYSDGRGSAFDNNLLTYKHIQHGTIADWGDLFFYEVSQTGSVNPETIRVQFDSLQIFRYSGAEGKMVHVYNEEIRYHPDGSIAAMIQAPLHAESRQIRTYDRAARCLTLARIRPGVSTYDTFLLRQIFFNASLQIIRDSTYKTFPRIAPADEITLFSYSGSKVTSILTKQWDGRLGQYLERERQDLLYYSNGLLKESRYSNDKYGTPLTFLWRDSFGYHPNAKARTFRRTSAPSSSAPAGYVNYEEFVCNSINQSGFTDSATIFAFHHITGDRVPQDGIRLLYDAENNPVSIRHSDIMSHAPSIYQFDTFLYEQYNVGISTITDRLLAVAIAPNPTTGYINVRCRELHEHERINIAVIDISGIVLYSEERDWSNNATKLNLTEALPAGLYSLHVTRVRDGHSGIVRFVKM